MLDSRGGAHVQGGHHDPRRMRRIAAPPSPAIPATAMPATSAPPEPPSLGDSSSGAVSKEYVGLGVAVGRSGTALVDPVEDMDGCGLIRVGVGLGVGAVDEACAVAGAVVGDEVGSGAGCVELLAVGVVGSGEREGLGEGFGDFVGVGVGSAMTSAHPREG